MHGDMTQSLRESVIRRLRAGQVEIVVATDVAARGLDVEQIEHVINYDVPYDVEAYVHRIGRTGRAGRSGLATMFITPRERKMMREIERYTGTQIKPMKMPTRADIAAKRIGVFKDTIRKTIAEGELDMYLELVEQLVEEGPFDMADIAAAAARIANGSRALVKAREEETNERVETRAESAPQRERSERPRPSDDARADSGAGDDVEDKTITLSMSVGRADGIRPADVVGSIANEADIPGREIGPIDIQEDVTYVGIPQRFVEVVLEKVGKARFRGRAVNLQVALPGAQTARRAPRADRDDRAPRKYDRGAGSGPRDRDSGSAPRSYDRSPSRGASSVLAVTTAHRAVVLPPALAVTTVRPAVALPLVLAATTGRPAVALRPVPAATTARRAVALPPVLAATIAHRAVSRRCRDRAIASRARPVPVLAIAWLAPPVPSVRPRARARVRMHAMIVLRAATIAFRAGSILPRTPKPFYSDVKKGGFKGKKRK